MTLSEHQHWLTDFYKQRNWYQLSPFIRLNFLTEEVGEVSQAIRAVEIGRDHPGEIEQSPAAQRDHLHEELPTRSTKSSSSAANTISTLKSYCATANGSSTTGSTSKSLVYYDALKLE
jgi:hypothetical protein